MKIKKKLGLVAIIGCALTLILIVGLGGSSGTVTASTPPDSEACYCTLPDLSLSQVDVYWENMAAYTARTLSVDYEVHNNSTNYANAKDVQVVGAVNTNGVTLSDNGRDINMVAAGECELFTMDYTVPPGAASFRTEVHAEAVDQCGNSYSYGGPMP